MALPVNRFADFLLALTAPVASSQPPLLDQLRCVAVARIGRPASALFPGRGASFCFIRLFRELGRTSKVSLGMMSGFVRNRKIKVVDDDKVVSSTVSKRILTDNHGQKTSGEA